MNALMEAIRQGLNMPSGTSDSVLLAMLVVGRLLIVASIAPLIISIYPAIS